MKQILLLLSLLPLMLYGQKVTPPIVPLPEHIEYKEGIYTFSKEFHVYVEQANTTFRYMQTELEKRFGIRAIQVEKREPADCVLLNTCRNSQSESYILTINNENVELRADSEIGLFYAFQSLLQLMAGSQKQPIEVNAQAITDEPRFAWRSFMLDEARFFKGEAEVLRLLDVMAELKMNVFHWHLTNDQGWRIGGLK